MDVINKFFSQEGDLLAEGRVLYAEAIHLGMVDKLPVAIRQYVAQTPNSLIDILELYELIDRSEIATPHPFFSPVPIHKENLCCEP